MPSNPMNDIRTRLVGDTYKKDAVKLRRQLEKYENMRNRDQYRAQVYKECIKYMEEAIENNFQEILPQISDICAFGSNNTITYDHIEEVKLSDTTDGKTLGEWKERLTAARHAQQDYFNEWRASIRELRYLHEKWKTMRGIS